MYVGIHVDICITFDYFPLLICLLSISSLDSERASKGRGKVLLPASWAGDGEEVQREAMRKVKASRSLSAPDKHPS